MYLCKAEKEILLNVKGDITMENNANEKKSWSPVQFDTVDPRIVALGTKSSEEKIYLILYVYREDGENMNSFDVATGRVECARCIERFVTDHVVDIHNSIIMVEIPAINVRGEAEWVMKHPNKSMTIYQFATRFSAYFSEDFNIEEYNYQNDYGDSDEGGTGREITMEDISAAINEKTVHTEAEVFDGSQELADAYREAMKNQ